MRVKMHGMFSCDTETILTKKESMYVWKSELGNTYFVAEKIY